MRTVARQAFHWEDHKDLIFQDRIVCSLVPHAIHPNHYHLKFEWRDEPTPEFFNLTNAKDNAWTICRRHYEEKLTEPH